MALAPYHETANLLRAALDVAGPELRKPIDRIEFVAGQILITAGETRIALNYRRFHYCDANGAPFAGGGYYKVEKAEPASSVGVLSRLYNMLARLR
ncbi:MAG: hypothetical protein AB1508_13370 [Pseudomonadota bacterium]